MRSVACARQEGSMRSVACARKEGSMRDVARAWKEGSGVQHRLEERQQELGLWC